MPGEFKTFDGEPLEWERIGYATFRMRVFGGWLVLAVAEGGKAMSFVPDDHGLWVPGKINRAGDIQAQRNGK